MMTLLEQMSDIRTAHAMTCDMLDKIEQEHRDTPPTFFGFPRRRHYELMAKASILKELADALFEEHSRLSKRLSEGGGR